jgi:hypothetical protein
MPDTSIWKWKPTTNASIAYTLTTTTSKACFLVPRSKNSYHIMQCWHNFLVSLTMLVRRLELSMQSRCLNNSLELTQKRRNACNTLCFQTERIRPATKEHLVGFSPALHRRAFDFSVLHANPIENESETARPCRPPRLQITRNNKVFRLAASDSDVFRSGFE